MFLSMEGGLSASSMQEPASPPEKPRSSANGSGHLDSGTSPFPGSLRPCDESTSLFLKTFGKPWGGVGSCGSHAAPSWDPRPGFQARSSPKVTRSLRRNSHHPRTRPRAGDGEVTDCLKSRWPNTAARVDDSGTLVGRAQPDSTLRCRHVSVPLQALSLPGGAELPRRGERWKLSPGREGQVPPISTTAEQAGKSCAQKAGVAGCTPARMPPSQTLADTPSAASEKYVMREKFRSLRCVGKSSSL